MPSKPLKKSTSAHAPSPVAQALQSMLRDTYAAFLTTHNYHWNVEGVRFVSLHTLFETQYTELFAAIDTIAERIRALGAYALPGRYDDIAKLMNNLPDPLSRAGAAEQMIENLIVLNEQVISSAQHAKRAAEKASDDETGDLMVERIQAHQKAGWMLRSLLK